RAQRMLQFAMSESGCPHDERAIRDSLSQCLIFLCVVQDLVRVYSGPRFLISDIVWVYKPEMAEPEIAHRTSGGADVQRISSSYQDNAEIFRKCLLPTAFRRLGSIVRGTCSRSAHPHKTLAAGRIPHTRFYPRAARSLHRDGILQAAICC